MSIVVVIKLDRLQFRINIILRNSSQASFLGENCQFVGDETLIISVFPLITWPRLSQWSLQC